MSQAGLELAPLAPAEPQGSSQLRGARSNPAARSCYKWNFIGSKFEASDFLVAKDIKAISLRLDGVRTRQPSLPCTSPPKHSQHQRVQPVAFAC